MAEPASPPAPRTALVTGATAGIGQATARRLIHAGWRVIGTGRRADRLEQLAEEFGPDAFRPLVLDMRDVDAVAVAVEGLGEPVDLLVNNAGLALGTAPAQESRLSDWQQMIDTNITGLVAVTHALLPVLIERRGAIVNLSSVAASYPYRGGNVYAGTKAFVRQFSLDLRVDLHGTGVRVTSIEPGMVETEFTLVRTGGDQAASDALYGGSDPMTGADIAETIAWVANLPPHLNVNTLEIMPVSQSFAGFQVARG
jgi:serine 3-dehydrogenase (NADP+)